MIVVAIDRSPHAYTAWGMRMVGMDGNLPFYPEISMRSIVET